MSTPDSTPKIKGTFCPQPGEPFRPYRRFTGSLIPEQIECSGLSFPARAVWARLARYEGENGDAFPRIATLARDLGTSAMTIKRSIRELEIRGLIERTRRGRRASVYRFLWHGVFDGSARIEPLRPAEVVSIDGPRQLRLPLSTGFPQLPFNGPDPDYQRSFDGPDPDCQERFDGPDPTPFDGPDPTHIRESLEENHSAEENQSPAPAAASHQESSAACQAPKRPSAPIRRRRGRLVRRGTLLLPIPPGREPEAAFDAAEQLRLFRELGLEQLARQLETEIEAEQPDQEETPCPTRLHRPPST